MQENEKWSRFLFKTNSIAQETLVLSIGPVGAMLFQNWQAFRNVVWFGCELPQQFQGVSALCSPLYCSSAFGKLIFTFDYL